MSSGPPPCSADRTHAHAPDGPPEPTNTSLTLHSFFAAAAAPTHAHMSATTSTTPAHRPMTDTRRTQQNTERRRKRESGRKRERARKRERGYSTQTTTTPSRRP